MRRKLDRSDYTSAAGARQLKAHSIVNGVRNNSYKRKIQWDVVVLTKPIPMSTKDTKAILGGATHVEESAKQIDRIAFKGRILDHDEIRSPHLLLEDPCSLAWGADTDAAARIISLHTTFVSKSGFTGKIPQVGDTVTVFLKPGDFSYNLQYAYFDLIRQSVDSEATAAGASTGTCERLRTKFNNHKPSGGAAVGTTTTPSSSSPPPPAGTAARARAGSTTPAVSNYPECVSGTRAWTSVSTTALARVIKANTSNRSIGVSILAMAITEQPERGRASVGGFNYNHWGIMADVGRGWGAAGRSYIACAVPSTEGAGGTGNRGARIRWFAAFASDADAVKFMIAVIGGRSDVDEAGNTISFATVTDGITWAKLHTLRWLSPSDKRDRIKDSTKMALKGRNWDTAAAVYDAI